MANSFKNAGVAVLATRTSLYTCPASTEAVVHALYLSNVDGTQTVYATVEATYDAGTTYAKLLDNAPIKPGEVLVFDKPLNLEASDILAITAGAANDVVAFASILEIT